MSKAVAKRFVVSKVMVRSSAPDHSPALKGEQTYTEAAAAVLEALRQPSGNGEP